MSDLNVIQRAMGESRPSCGVWAIAPSQVTAEVMGRGGLDWILFDTQHGAVGWDGLVGLVQAAELGGTSAVVRVAANDPYLIMRALDVGAIGVVVPMVSTPEEARSAARAMRYPPDGDRSYGPLRRVGPAGSPTCLVMIETEEGMANLDAIAATPGVDGLFVGPVDLGLALGVGVQTDGASEVVRRAVVEIVSAAQRHGKIVGAASLNASHAETLLQDGVRLLTVGSDRGYLRMGLEQDRTQVARWTAVFGEGASHAPGDRGKS